MPPPWTTRRNRPGGQPPADAIASGAGDADRAWRRARRRAAREHHPDLGGDAESLQRALAAVDASFGRGPAAGAPPRVSRGLRSRAARALHRAALERRRRRRARRSTGRVA